MFRLGLVTLTLSAVAFAQTGGTSTTSIQQPTVRSAEPLVTTPTLTLSNGFTPATIHNQPSLVVEQPETLSTINMPESEGVEINAPAAETSVSDFNFASVNPQSAFNFGMAGPSLGEIARQFKNGHVQAHKTYTNEDIDRLTSQAPSNGIISAMFANGQPILDRNHSGFSPMSGIANLPDVTGEERTEMASSADRGQDSARRATTPSTDAVPANGNRDNQQLPASDNPR